MPMPSIRNTSVARWSSLLATGLLAMPVLAGTLQFEPPTEIPLLRDLRLQGPLLPVSREQKGLRLYLGQDPEGRGWSAIMGGDRRLAARPVIPPGGAVSAAVRLDLDSHTPGDLLLLHRGALELLASQDDGEYEGSVIRLEGVAAVAAGDLDRDGHGDLYLALDKGPDRVWLHQGQTDPRGIPDYAEEPIGEEVENVPPPALALELLDLDADGDLDLVRAQEGGLAILFNNGLGRFSRLNLVQGLIGGCRRALSLDADGDGLVDLLLHDGCPGALLLNRGRLRFERRELAIPALEEGEARLLQWSDPDNDGHPDLLILRAGELLLVPLRGGRAGRPRSLQEGLSRARLLDLDGDGWEDLLARDREGRLLLRYQKPDRSHWLGVHLRGWRGGPLEGAVLTVIRRDGGHVSSHLTSASPLGGRLRVGLGRLSQIDLAVIEWPSGMSSRLAPPKLDHYSLIREPQPEHRRPVYRRAGKAVRTRLAPGMCR